MSKAAIEIIPMEVWAIIAKHLDLQSIGRFRSVCSDFYNNAAIKDEVMKIWFEDLAAQFQGPGAVEAKILLRYCCDNLDNPTILLQLADKLLHYRSPHSAAVQYENDVDQSIDKLTRIVYQNLNDNPKELLIRSIKFLTAHSQHIVATPKTFIARDRNFDRRFRYAAYSSIALMVIGLINQILGYSSHRRGLLTPLCFALAVLLVIAAEAKRNSFFERYRYPGFWKKVDDLPALEQNQLTHLQRLMAQSDSERRILKCVVGVTIGVGIASLILVFLLIKFLTATVEQQPSIEPRGPSTP
ncbi:MAG: hypothetical protein M3R00_10420 [Pseudomonadota bacterium]|nr:hypothetical protein [Pseudomonadota bacterium]